MKNEDYKIFWDFIIQTYHVIEACRPDLVVVAKKRRTCKTTGFEAPGESKDWGKGEREDRKVSRSNKGVTEDLECGS